MIRIKQAISNAPSSSVILPTDEAECLAFAAGKGLGVQFGTDELGPFTGPPVMSDEDRLHGDLHAYLATVQCTNENRELLKSAFLAGALATL